MNIPRAFAALGSWLLIRIIITPAVLFVYLLAQYKRHGSDVTEPVMTVLGTAGSATGIIVGVLTAFMMGWWGSLGLSKRWFAQGALIGAMMVVFGVILNLVVAEIDALALTWLLDGVAAILGAAFARHRALAETR